MKQYDDAVSSFLEKEEKDRKLVYDNFIRKDCLEFLELSEMLTSHDFHIHSPEFLRKT